jgi:hypothetical protein
MLMRSAPLNYQQDRASPLAADPDALHETQEGENHRTPDADGVVGRHEAHQERSDSHQHQCYDQCPFAADPIAIMSENDRPDWPRNKADRIYAECL